MATFKGWTIVTIPDTPASPASVEFTQVDAVAMNVSPFSGQQQVQNWNATWMEAIVTMPAMTYAQGQNWVAFLRALEGTANVFQFSAAFATAFPLEVSGVYWRLKTSKRKWSISLGKFYGLQFEIVEAL